MIRILRGALTLALALSAGPARGYEAVSVTDGGSLTGRVTFAGSPLRFGPVPVRKDREACGQQVEPEVLVVGPSGGVKGAAVLIEGVGRGKRPEGEVVLDNAKCRFVPHVAVVMEGGPARIRNSDPILHNTHGLWDGKATAFNVALPRGGRDVPLARYLKRPGVIEVRCDAHTHMRAWLVVHDSPYFAVTDEAGNFRIDGIPPGKYTVTLWHPGYVQKGVDKDGRPVYDEPRRLTREVTIPPRGVAVADFQLR